ncbi:MAG TPA: hypothetical protein VJO15_05735, partial [Dehalococcoidia bacterium]|nr:hypothetical protein [Dehalococcoidia bacterium]
MIYRHQRQWGWLSAIEMFCSAGAGGAYLTSVASYLLAGKAIFAPGVLASVALVAAAIALLLFDMPSVWLAPKALANLRSPQARGGLSLAVFAVL